MGLPLGPSILTERAALAGPDFVLCFRPPRKCRSGAFAAAVALGVSSSFGLQTNQVFFFPLLPRLDWVFACSFPEHQEKPCKTNVYGLRGRCLMQPWVRPMFFTFFFSDSASCLHA